MPVTVSGTGYPQTNTVTIFLQGGDATSDYSFSCPTYSGNFEVFFFFSPTSFGCILLVMS